MENHCKNGWLSGRSEIYLWIVLLTAIPASGYSQYSQNYPKIYGVEQVFIPFSKSILSIDFHLEHWSENTEIISNTVYPDYHFIQEAFNHSISIILQVQGNQFLSTKGSSITLFQIRYLSDYQDEDDMRA